MHRILEALYTVPSSLNLEELFNSLLSQESSADAPEFNMNDGNSNSAPPKGEAAAKRLN